VHSGDGDAVFKTHQLGQHLRPLNDGNLASVGFDDFWICCGYSGAGDNHRGPGDVLGIVAS